VPAAAVIPAPIAYIKVVAVKASVVGSRWSSMNRAIRSKRTVITKSFTSNVTVSKGE
jgi:hypothetical protein